MAVAKKTAVKTANAKDLYVLASAQQNDCYVHHAPINDVDKKCYSIKKGREDACEFSGKELDKYLETLPENNGLEIIEA